MGRKAIRLLPDGCLASDKIYLIVAFHVRGWLGFVPRWDTFSNVELELADGIKYLRDFGGKIDLLYLDFRVFDEAEDLPGTGRVRAYQAVYTAARVKLNPVALILIDDTDHIHPWKHTQIVPSARLDGFTVLHCGRQTLLMRE